jgi:hypothetical protein
MKIDAMSFLKSKSISYTIVDLSNENVHKIKIYNENQDSIDSSNENYNTIKMKRIGG